jgi:adenylate kinase
MLREEIKAASELGNAAKSIMASGGLVDDDLVNQMLANRVAQPDCAHGFLLDGFPRTVEQAEYLDGVLNQHHFQAPVVLHLDVPMDALIGRLTSRRQCPVCRRIYNLLHQPPKVAGVCDDDGTPLITRKDDSEDVAKERIRTYDEWTRPVLAYYQDRKYHQIRGDRSPAYIFEVITGILEPVVSKNGSNCCVKAAKPAQKL